MCPLECQMSIILNMYVPTSLIKLVVYPEYALPSVDGKIYMLAMREGEGQTQKKNHE